MARRTGDPPAVAGASEATNPPDGRVLTAETLPYYLGGFLGPFGTMIIISVYPELRDTFGASTSAVNWTFSAYLLPMAALLLVSGTIGERLGRRRTVRVTFIGYALASLLAAVAPTLGWLIAARALQGIANAFITPLLIAGLSEVIAAERLGRAVGVYGSFQATGSAVAPLAGGLIATVDWRWSFVLVAAVSAGLAFRPPPGAPRPGADAPPIRPLLTRRMVTLWTAAFTAAAGPLGAAVLVGLYLRDELDVDSASAGVILLLAGASTMLLGPTWGRLLDQWGARRSSFVAVTWLVLSVAPLGLIDDPVLLALAWTVVGAAVGFVVIIIQQLAAVAVPDNRGGSVSSVLSFRFSGHAIGPLVWVPVFTVSAAWAFVGSAALGLVTLVALVVVAPGPVTATSDHLAVAADRTPSGDG